MAIAPQWLLAFAGDRDGVLKAASTADGLADPPSALDKRQKDEGGSATFQSSVNQFDNYGIEPSRPEPWSEEGVARLRSALAAIPAVDRDVWLKVGFALHDLAAADPRWPGRALWDEWSKTCPGKFDPADQDKTWASFGRGYEGPRVTLATVFHLAQKNGWIDPSGAPPSAGAADAPARQSQADILIAIANRRAELFHAPDGTAYADIEVNGHRETWPIRSRGFRKWLCHAFFEATNKAASSEAQQSALGVVEARAQFASVERAVHVRVAGLEGKLYLDLCDPVWRAVEIDAAGWRVIDRAPTRFRRAAGMRPLPVPERGGAISDLRPFLNVASDGDFVLIVAWLLACLRDRRTVSDSGRFRRARVGEVDRLRDGARVDRSLRRAVAVVAPRGSRSFHCCEQRPSACVRQHLEHTSLAGKLALSHLDWRRLPGSRAVRGQRGSAL